MDQSTQRTAVIIGAGPAGLTAAIEFQRQGAIKPIVLEASNAVGGLARTVCYKGNRMDIGGHRFFSKSDRVMQWWLEMMPLENVPVTCDPAAGYGELRYKGQTRSIPAPTAAPAAEAAPEVRDRVMLVRQRKSRIFHRRRFFDYPLTLNPATLRNLGLRHTLRCGFSYLRSALLPRREEKSLEDFLINRFGHQLYLTFFKSYTEKVWGVPCDRISAAWGAERIKGLSLKRAAVHFFAVHFFKVHFLKTRRARAAPDEIAQKKTETSLIEKFLYPRLGPGQLWEHVSEVVRKNGGEIRFGVTIDRIRLAGNRVVSVEGVDEAGERHVFAADYFLSTMPVRDLIRAIAVVPGQSVPAEVTEVSEGLIYRDFITVGLLASKLAIKDRDGSAIKDNWIYIQEPDVLVGRLQIYNNWSPSLVNNSDKVWIGLEYFCNETDALWKMTDEEMARFAIAEAVKIGILKAEDVEDWHVVRVPKTYPAYFGSYNRFAVIRDYVDRLENLYLVGRNGMHKYNNQDHSMLTAMAAVENIVSGNRSKDNIWAINTEMEYHEEKTAT